MERNFSESEVTLHRCIPVCIFLRKTVSETCLTAVKVQRVGGWGGRGRCGCLFIKRIHTAAKSDF